MTTEEVIDLIKLTRDDQYECSFLHSQQEINVHIFKPTIKATQWYIKFYFIEPGMYFVSVHKSEN